MRQIGHVSVGTLYINSVQLTVAMVGHFDSLLEMVEAITGQPFRARMTVAMVGHFDSLLEMAEAIKAGQPFRARIWTPKS